MSNQLTLRSIVMLGTEEEPLPFTVSAAFEEGSEKDAEGIDTTFGRGSVLITGQEGNVDFPFLATSKEATEKSAESVAAIVEALESIVSYLKSDGDETVRLRKEFIYRRSIDPSYLTLAHHVGIQDRPSFVELHLHDGKSTCGAITFTREMGPDALAQSLAVAEKLHAAFAAVLERILIVQKAQENPERKFEVVEGGAK
jgi:hypothetical protein